MIKIVRLLYIWQVRFIMYGNCIFPSLGLYSLAYIRPHIVHIIYWVFIYTKS